MTVAPVGRSGSTVHAETSIPRPRHLVEHEPPERVVADDPAEGDPQLESRRATGEDRRRAADGHHDRADDPLDLAEDGHRVRIGDDDIGVDLADDEDVDVAIGRGHAQ